VELRSPADGPAVAGSDVDAGITLAPAGDAGARGDETGVGPLPEGTGAAAGGAEAAGEPEAAGADEAQADEVTSSPWAGRLAWASFAAVLVVLGASAGRAIVTGWVPVGDSALIAVRSRDVLGGGPGGDLPLLGMWASASWSVGFDISHPGPLLYDALAVPAALVGGGGGLVVGTALIGMASVAGILLAARRVAGPVVAAVAMAVTGLLCWSMGSEVLIEPWHAGTVLLPFLCCAVLAWATLAGDSLCLPWAVLAGSLVLATNLSYTVLVPVLLLAATGSVAVSAWRRRAGGWRRDAVALGSAALVAVLCWIQPLIEQVTADEGNLSRLRRSQSVDRVTLGWRTGYRAVADVVAVPPWWVRPSYSHDFRLAPFGNDLPAAGIAAASLVVVAALIGLAAWAGRRARDRTVVAAAAVAGALLLGAVVTAVQTPTSDFGTIAYQVRWLWPVGAFITFALLVAVLRLWRPAASPARAWRPAAAFAALATLAAAATLPAANNGTTAPPSTYPVARNITDAVARADLPARVEVGCGEGVFDPYCEAVMAQLQDRGTGFVVTERIGVRQLGEGRRSPGGLPRLVVVAGDYALFTPDGAEVVTRHPGLSRDEQLELFYLRENLKGALADGEIRPSARGERAAGQGDLPSVSAEGTGWHIDPATAVDIRPSLYGTHRRDLGAMVQEGLLDADPRWREPLARYVELQDRWDEATVAVFLLPARG
jgi:hypothetical protein